MKTAFFNPKTIEWSVNARNARASAIKADLFTTRSNKEEHNTGLNTGDVSPLMEREDAGMFLTTKREDDKSDLSQREEGKYNLSQWEVLERTVLSSSKKY